MYNFRLTGNSKTGVMPITRSPATSCPDTCSLKNTGCYAETGFISIHWRKDAIKGVDFNKMLTGIKKIQPGTVWRHNEAGDLDHNNGIVDTGMLEKLVLANKGKRGFTYTHHDPVLNKDAIKKANEDGFVINLSADNLEIADANMALNIAPVVVLLPIDAPKVSYTPNGHKVVACHADSTEKVKCANCKLCALPKRDYIIGFRAHGARKNKVAKIALNDIS